MIGRRVILFSSLGVIGLPARAADLSQEDSAWRWIYGEWRSDVEMTMKNYTFQKKRPTQENLVRIASLFGKMTHEIFPRKFSVVSLFNGVKHREEYAFRVSRYTPSSITLNLRGKEGPPYLTLYKGENFYMVRAGDNFEYFRKVT